MSVFVEQSFNDGGWAGALAKVLRQRQIISDKKPVARVWRATWKQWIQFEPREFPGGPAQWLGKPAVLVSEDLLYCGYYVERGYSEHERPEYVMSSEWHWHSFLRTITDAIARPQLNELMESLDPARRCIWLSYGGKSSRKSYDGEASLEQL